MFAMLAFDVEAGIAFFEAAVVDDDGDETVIAFTALGEVDE